MSTNKRLTGKVALVTGAGDPRSIGRGIARALADEGADVIVNDIRSDWLSSAVKDIQARGVRGAAFAADVSKPDQVAALFADAVAALGRIDIVASNAGIIRWEKFLDITPENLRAMVDVNLKGNIIVCRAAAKQMIAQGGGGRIVITSSVQASIHFPITPVYGATKRAMFPLVGALAIELAPHNIIVNHIGPGWVQSALNDPEPGQQTEEGIEATRQSVPLKRAGLIEEMGRAVVYYASADGDYVTGTYLRLDGGLGISKYTL
ncbi:MAG: SDR family oxidoreductase [Chloroflexi bacterium]|jgi:NAD(P)-dependent dehydrogenase (short-subunit alcohol dehydrogenase family)|nr:SDR family NAD(P)-dependent oxidoreductase [Chloroflexota bacterium]MBV6437044.1 Oxidoreductase UcpA [Anaerolineae bacterium]MDL1915849.1 SDR family oxidoreductase [Anaerolineae bacterium CFX4]MBW7879800.1 SDR family oxidoreductase [Anaerolineae bacterium]MCC6565044.1 SDR family oxidoreductase [Chloroflexota bacterium]